MVKQTLCGEGRNPFLEKASLLLCSDEALVYCFASSGRSAPLVQLGHCEKAFWAER